MHVLQRTKHQETNKAKTKPNKRNKNESKTWHKDWQTCIVRKNRKKKPFSACWHYVSSKAQYVLSVYGGQSWSIFTLVHVPAFSLQDRRAYADLWPSVYWREMSQTRPLHLWRVISCALAHTRLPFVWLYEEGKLLLIQKLCSVEYRVANRLSL